jgi:hypothetical protein
MPTGIPYRGWKRWHTIIGLVFGLGAATWAFSGLLSMDPFPTQRTGGPQGGRGGGPNIVQALRGRVPLDAFADKLPADALRQLTDRRVKELELTSFVGDPVYLATIAAGDTWIVPVKGDAQRGFDPRRITDVLKRSSQASGGAEISTLTSYDRYYLDRRHGLPLPVLLVRLNDLDRTRLYVDPRTARVVGSYSAGRWMNRWLYHGLHSLNFPWLYDYRPLWDVVVLTFVIGGTALCLTSVVLAWRVLERKLTGARSTRRGPRLAVSEDLSVPQ